MSLLAWGLVALFFSFVAGVIIGLQIDDYLRAKAINESLKRLDKGSHNAS